MKTFRLQVQAVLFQNDKESLLRSVSALSNAVQADRAGNGFLASVTLAWGDASDPPVFTENEIAELNRQYADILSVSYRFFGENTGYGRGNNLLALNADADLLLIENPDVLINGNFFATMLPLLMQDDAGMVEARQVPYDLSKRFDEKTLETPWVSGACFIIPKKIFARANGFDDSNFFMYSEDVDLSFRVRLMGKKLYYQPQASVFHSKRFDSNGALHSSSAEMRFMPEAALTLAYKWGNEARLQQLEAHYEMGTVEEVEALNAFRKRRDEKQLTRIRSGKKIFCEEDLKARYML